MYGYRLGAIGIVCTFFAIIFSTVLMPMVLFNPKKTESANNYASEDKVRKRTARPTNLRQRRMLLLPHAIQ